MSAGGDTLAGNKGNDVLTGGTGADTFQFETGGGSDTLTDYEDGVDKFEILSGATGFGSLTLSQSGVHARVAFSGSDFLVKNATVGDLGASDFIF